VVPFIVDDISENDSASVSAMSLAVVISLLPFCKCLISVGGRFPEFYFVQTRLRKVRLFNPYVAIGGILPPRRTFYPVALKPLRIVTKAFVTCPEYMWAKKC